MHELSMLASQKYHSLYIREAKDRHNAEHRRELKRKNRQAKIANAQRRSQ